MKNNTSDEVSHAALMIYPRILGAGQNAQNIDFPKSVPYKIFKAKAKAKKFPMSMHVCFIFAFFILHSL